MTDKPMNKSATFEITLDFEKMMEQVLEKHWGYWGERPESFEEYCCMAVAERLADSIEMNEFKAAKIVDAVRVFLEAEGQKIAERVGERVSSQSWRWDSLGNDIASPEKYFEDRVRMKLEALADEKARRIAESLEEES